MKSGNIACNEMLFVKSFMHDSNGESSLLKIKSLSLAIPFYCDILDIVRKQ